MGRLHAQCRLCSGGHQLSLPSSWLKCHWAVLLPGVVASPSNQLGPGDTGHRRRAVIQLLTSVWANWALEPAELLVRGSESGRSAPHRGPRSECAPDWVVHMSKATGWDYHLGTAGMNSVCQYPRADCCNPLPASPSQSDSPISYHAQRSIPDGTQTSI